MCASNTSFSVLLVNLRYVPFQAVSNFGGFRLSWLINLSFSYHLLKPADVTKDDYVVKFGVLNSKQQKQYAALFFGEYNNQDRLTSVPSFSLRTRRENPDLGIRRLVDVIAVFKLALF